MKTEMRGWLRHVCDRRLVIGLAMVPVGFLAGAPLVPFEFHKFVREFMFNYVVTPRYGGQTGHLGYVDFLLRLPELVGIPGALFLIALILISIGVVLKRWARADTARQLFLVSGAVVLLYTLKIGAFPRVQTRFALPLVPFLLLMAAPALQLLARWRWLMALAAPLFLYNCVCSALVGQRFNSDPRHDALTWMQQHLAPHSVIESSAGSPHWDLLPGLHIREIILNNTPLPRPADDTVLDLRLPHASGRNELFQKIFRDNHWVADSLSKIESPVDDSLFTAAALRERRPALVTIHSSDREVPDAAVRHYYDALLAGEFPYTIVYDATSPPASRWIYPREIDFLVGRMTILARRN
ncbi:MAG: hypothetical protein M3R59_10665 [Verrucomicrobiota bacterium]|nr:hypothetical protein [Verrucomicrobiota bacterium]